jgi:hypothetical protein
MEDLGSDRGHRAVFDTIDQEVLLDRVACAGYRTPLLLSLLGHWLTADVLDFRDLVPTDLGVPQGSPIFPCSRTSIWTRSITTWRSDGSISSDMRTTSCSSPEGNHTPGLRKPVI